MKPKNTALLLAFASLGLFLIAFFVPVRPDLANQPAPAPQALPSIPPAGAQSISDGTITITYGSDWGLALNPSELQASSYIPPCDGVFNYCFYYNNAKYQETNFESAGMRVSEREDLTNEGLCLDTPPPGYDASTVSDAKKSADAYSVSVFADLQQGALGHYSMSTLYRLFTPAEKRCYELETRIGEGRYENFPEGTIRRFSDDERREIGQELRKLAGSTSVAGSPVELP